MRGALRGSSFAWEGTASMRGAVRGSVKGCCRARRRALRSLFSLINFLPRTVPRPAFLFSVSMPANCCWTHCVGCCAWLFSMVLPGADLVSQSMCCLQSLSFCRAAADLMRDEGTSGDQHGPSRAPNLEWRMLTGPRGPNESVRTVPR